MVKTGMIPYADMVPKAVLTEMQNQMGMLQASLKKIGLPVKIAAS